jgi:hypothetical protein
MGWNQLRWLILLALRVKHRALAGHQAAQEISNRTIRSQVAVTQQSVHQTPMAQVAIRHA